MQRVCHPRHANKRLWQEGKRESGHHYSIWDMIICTYPIGDNMSNQSNESSPATVELDEFAGFNLKSRRSPLPGHGRGKQPPRRGDTRPVALADDDPQRLGDRIRLLRQLRGMTQTQLAEASGVAQPIISRIERNDQTDPTISQVTALAAALDVDFNVLIGMSTSDFIAYCANVSEEQIEETPSSGSLLAAYGHELIKQAGEEFVEDLNKWVQSGMNILVSGGLSTGRTSMLHALRDIVEQSRPVRIIEDDTDMRGISAAILDDVDRHTHRVDQFGDGVEQLITSIGSDRYDMSYREYLKALRGTEPRSWVRYGFGEGDRSVPQIDIIIHMWRRHFPDGPFNAVQSVHQVVPTYDSPEVIQLFAWQRESDPDRELKRVHTTIRTAAYSSDQDLVRAADLYLRAHEADEFTTEQFEQAEQRLRDLIARANKQDSSSEADQLGGMLRDATKRMRDLGHDLSHKMTDQINAEPDEQAES